MDAWDAWLSRLERTVYYKPTKVPAKVRPELAGPIKALIEEGPLFGYRTVAALLSMNKNTVQRIFQLQGWQVCSWQPPQNPGAALGRHGAKPALGDGPVPGVGRAQWLVDLALVIDCHTRQLLGWQFSRSGRAIAAAAALEQALITRYGALGRVPVPFRCARTTAWCSPPGTTLACCAAMG